MIYDNPFRGVIGALSVGQIDQGVDFTVGQDSPVYAIGAGTVKIYWPVNSGWPNPSGKNAGAFIAYELADGPAKGFWVYIAENLTLEPLAVGARVEATTKIATLHSYCETGWASTNGNDTALAQQFGGYDYQNSYSTKCGFNFDQLLAALGVPASQPKLTPSGELYGTLPTGLPADWKKAIADFSVVAMAATGDGGGYWMVSASGIVARFGDAGALASSGGDKLDATVVGIATSVTIGDGYYV